MRVYGRILQPYPPSGVQDSQQFVYGDYKWIVIDTDRNSDSSYCYVTALCQCLRLNLQESPFYAQFGIPAEMVVWMQLQPDYYVQFITSYFSQFFASLIVSKRPQTPTNESFAKGGTPYTTPIYDVSAILTNGTLFQTTIGI